MKMILVAFMALSSLAKAGDVYNCEIGYYQHSKQGTAKLEILNVMGNNKLKHFNFEIESFVINLHGGNASNKMVHMRGQLSGSINANGYLFAQGTVVSTGKGQIINPENIRIQGSVNQQGVIHAALSDDNRVFQLGYGVPMGCKLQN